jgi:hypothetical protein
VTLFEDPGHGATIQYATAKLEAQSAGLKRHLGVALGAEIAHPIIGLLITLVILRVT